jgi:hypothetical protein
MGWLSPSKSSAEESLRSAHDVLAEFLSPMVAMANGLGKEPT